MLLCKLISLSSPLPNPPPNTLTLTRAGLASRNGLRWGPGVLALRSPGSRWGVWVLGKPSNGYAFSLQRPPPLASAAQAEQAGSPPPFHFLHQITSTEELMGNGQMGSILM